MIENGENEIILHGLGAAIPRTVNLALQLSEKLHGTFDLYTETGTVQVVDDIEPLTDLAEGDVQIRQNSAIHIQLIRTALCGINKGALVVFYKLNNLMCIKNVIFFR